MRAHVYSHRFDVGDIIQLNDTDNPHILMVLEKLPDKEYYLFLEMRTGRKHDSFITPKLWSKIG